MADDASTDTAGRWPVAAGELPDRAFELIVARTAHPFVAIERDGTIRYASGSIETLLGWTAAELTGRNMVEFLAPGEVEKAVASLHELTDLDRYGSGVPMVFEVIRPDGSSTWVQVGALPLVDLPEFDGLVLRHQSWDHNHHFDRFLNALLASEPMDQVCTALCRSIAASLHAQGAAVHQSFSDGHFAHAHGADLPPACYEGPEGPWVEAANTGEPVHVSVADLPAPVRTAAEAAGFSAVWTIPIPAMDHLPPAVLSVWRTEPGAPLLGHRMVLETSSRYVQLALTRWAEHQRLVHLAGHDALTGVANRSLFRDRLVEALEIGEQELAVAFCDLDAFKPVNDTYGHQIGDLVLVQVVERLGSALRVGDELARLGGDEFTIVMRNVPDADAARHLADRLLATMEEPFDAGGHPVSIGVSIGVALVEPGLSADALLSLADNALYTAKRAGGRQARIVGSPD